ncbi:hypothetical protein CZ809_03021 [Photobacterium piscicola]|uniref:Type 4 fimbrial biogenesis protein PilX N-terminal domain-containing protein n=1 Tax=Photobacterium piscicola TaxID=1378299 RepID=A0A1T5I305_9GAMM|nr:hypothetical protein [Photobacterium piscicola]SKC33431.1 hypothetical protein CZ809_03021 [Photobacterium piscicola]
MNKHQQSGMTTLLITSMLLIVALLFSLASYKNLFYQIKRTQNEVLARQAHWAAEGGLECGFAAIQDAGSISGARPTFNACETSLKLADVDVDVDNYINSEYDNISSKALKKKIKLSSSIAGAIQSRSDLKLVGAYTISPDVEDINSDNKYKCVAIRFSKEITIKGALVSSINPTGTGKVSYDKFPPGGECSASYQTDTNKETGSWDIDKSTSTDNPSESGVFRLDLVRDKLFDPFESFFGDKRSELENIKKEFEVIAGSKSNEINKRCDKLISVAFTLNDKVWVEGDCDLLDADYLNKMDVIHKNKPKVLVIENGIIAKWASADFTGSVYHLIDPIIYPVSDLKSKWNVMPTNTQISTFVENHSVYIDGGSFNTTGGIVFDTPGGLTTIMGGMNLSYDRGKNPLPINNKITWQQGSWHDF